ncbi:hypothetical protein POX_f08309 [Penicillium oxalicum]|uniref:Uncharacterized protein n=1 Tax=Penicillium oxalicum (strain 114-2 / CGMCC 5302) TaxID=933388 RepID=S7ZKR2_PENO1|nr:hypothetical protein POX_f08309 [Penicillium oxalicum]EPS29266.1 hypothetical protein PDE_04215 [Penicillium oxalicum 114-2]KAI2787927.1 hypothetical protein POX_f08309 [Penicillium oxalicum]
MAKRYISTVGVLTIPFHCTKVITVFSVDSDSSRINTLPCGGQFGNSATGPAEQTPPVPTEQLPALTGAMEASRHENTGQSEHMTETAPPP